MSVRAPRKYVCFKHRYYRKGRSGNIGFFGSSVHSVIPHCPICQKEMQRIDQFVKIPNKSDLKGWDILEKLYKEENHNA